jgi:Protein of unknown function (DUF3515)
LLRLRLLPGIAGAAVVVAGCALAGDAAVEVAPPEPAPAAARLCRGLAARLPAVVDGGDRRDVSPASPYVAAWGDPAIVLRCGVARPRALLPGAELVTVNGVDWLPEQQDDGYRFTTAGRAAYVEAWVPARYAPEVDPLVDLAAAVTSAVPVD